MATRTAGGVERAQQREAVAAHSRIVGVDHYAVEDGIDRLAQRGEMDELLRVVSGFRVQRFGFFELGVKRLFGGALKAARLDGRGAVASLLEDVAHAFIGHREIDGRRVRGETVRGLQAAEVERLRDAERSHGLERLAGDGTAVERLADEIGAQAFLDELAQLGERRRVVLTGRLLFEHGLEQGRQIERSFGFEDRCAARPTPRSAARTRPCLRSASGYYPVFTAHLAQHDRQKARRAAPPAASRPRRCAT